MPPTSPAADRHVTRARTDSGTGSGMHTLSVPTGKWRAGVTIQSKVTHRIGLGRGLNTGFPLRARAGPSGAPRPPPSLPPGCNEVSPQAAAAPRPLCCSGSGRRSAPARARSPGRGVPAGRQRPLPVPGCAPANQRAPRRAPPRPAAGGPRARAAGLVAAPRPAAPHARTSSSSPRPAEAQAPGGEGACAPVTPASAPGSPTDKPGPPSVLERPRGRTSAV